MQAVTNPRLHLPRLSRSNNDWDQVISKSVGHRECAQTHLFDFETITEYNTTPQQ